MGKKNKSELGRACLKYISENKKGKKIVHKSNLYTVDFKDSADWGRLNLQSVTEESSLQEFMSIAELARTEFKAEKLSGKILGPDKKCGILSKDETLRIKDFHEENKNILRIPRRPEWNANTTAEKLHEDEKDIFLEWRRALAKFQEENNVVMTPFEKQLEFWRQLWRTVEKSDVIVQIVDARNPLLFRCEDLETYVKEVSDNKINVLLVNKADLLTEDQRKFWAEYFSSINVKTIFFSATLVSVDENDDDHVTLEANEQKKIDEEVKNNEESERESLSVNELRRRLRNIEIKVGEVERKIDTILYCFVNSSKILSPKQLKELLREIHQGPKVTEGITTVGFVGYPNVGKSSTINSLLGTKKVSTSSTAGKTKHLQTIYLDHNIILCDCPGLVMPSFVFTKADLVINGILRVDELRDYVAPVNLVAKLIPRHIFEATYNIIIPKSSEDSDKCLTSEELLNAYAYSRGFMTANGQPDKARAARYVLKDFQHGKLLYCTAPPCVSQEFYHIWPEQQKTIPKYIPPKTLRAIKVSDQAEDIDCHIGSGVHVKNPRGKLSEYLDPGCEKPWKKLNKHANKNKKEKLRRVYAHLDQH